MRRTKDPAGVAGATVTIEAEVGELLIRLLSSVRDHFMSSLAEMDLTPAQGFALHHLEEPLPMRRLAAEMGYDASHITGIVDKLEGRGLVERRADPRDRRIKLLVTTTKGRELRRRIQNRVFDRQPILDRLDPDERHQLLELLRRAVGDDGSAAGHLA